MSREDLEAIGRRIKAARKSLKKQQKEVAAFLQMAPSYLSEIENGNAKPGPDFFLKLSRKLKIRMEYIFHGTGEIFYQNDELIDTMESEPFNFSEELDSPKKLLWLMDQSIFFKNTILSLAGKFILEDEKAIKKSMKIAAQSRKKKEQKALIEED